MDKNYLIQLTENLYRLTLLFPKKEPLRYKMREIADDILVKWVRFNFAQNQVLDDLEILDSFFEVAKAQNWVTLDEVLRIQEEYNRIKTEIKKFDNHPSEPPVEAGIIDVNVDRPHQNQQEQPIHNVKINERQEKILEFLKENGRVQVWQLKQIFPEVTKRTLRRDFKSLLKRGVIERIGEKNATFYQIKVGQG